MSDLTALQRAQGEIEIMAAIFDAGLGEAIEAALAVPAPNGSPATVEERVRLAARIGANCATVSADIHSVAGTTLPQNWKGLVAESAAQAIAALGSEIATMQAVFEQASLVMADWGSALAWAQSMDKEGVEQLQQALGKLGPWAQYGFAIEVWNFPEAQELAAQGVARRIAAAVRVQDASAAAASTLNELASRARAELVGTNNFDALDAVVLANQSNPGGALADGGLILTDTELTRGEEMLNGMSLTEAAPFDAMERNAKSPQEAAYLWKMLAAGHTMAQIEAFDALIHPHGDDPTWLAEHLTPTLSTKASGTESAAQLTLTYKGQEVTATGTAIYSQGGYSDCVAASTVLASAQLDPSVMLDLTTGGTANGDDSAAALQQRLQALYQGQYVKGLKADGDSNTSATSTSGLGSTAETMLANTDLGKVTGSNYSYVSLGSAGDRQAALTRIEAAVDSGKPVPIDVTGAVNGNNEGHQMMIMARNGDMLEIYNPWGFTSWVSESQFVNSDLGALTGTDNLATADGLELPS